MTAASPAAFVPVLLGGSPFKRRPSVVVYGPTGSGKSTDLSRAMPRNIHITTNAGTTRPYYSWIREAARSTFDAARAEYLKAKPGDTDAADQYALSIAAKESGMQYPLAQAVVPAGVSWWSWLTEMRNWFSALWSSGQCPFEGFVIDEMTSVLDQVYREMWQAAPGIPQFKSRSGNVDDFKVMDAVEDWLRDWIKVSRDTGCSAGFVCQEQNTKYYEDPTKLHYGEQKYPAGPMVPFGRLLTIICYEPDVCLRVTLKSAGLSAIAGLGKPAASSAPVAVTPMTWRPKGHVTRKYWTETSKEALAKFRDVAINPEEDLDLPALLRRADYL